MRHPRSSNSSINSLVRITFSRVGAPTSRAFKYRAEMLVLYSECLAKGGYTNTAAEYYDEFNPKFGGDKEKIKELFGYDVRF